MNVFMLMTLIAVPGLALTAYHFASPFGVIVGIIAAIVGAAAGFFIAPVLGYLFLLPFEGAARLCRFITTGRWTDPQFTPPPRPTSNDRNA